MYVSSFRGFLLISCVLLLHLSRAQHLSTIDYVKIQFIESQPSTGNYLNFSAENKSDIDTAIVWLNSMFADSAYAENKAWLFYQRGRLYYLREEILLAQKDLEAALDSNPQYYEALERLSTLSFNHLKNYTKRKVYITTGIKAYEEELKKDSTSAVLWYYYARFLELEQNFSAAENSKQRINAWLQCLKYDSTFAEGWFELSYLHADAPEVRLNYLFRALHFQESWLYRSHILATLEQDIKEDKRTLEFLDACIALYETKLPDYSNSLCEYYKKRASIYAKQKRYELQRQDLARLKELQ